MALLILLIGGGKMKVVNNGNKVIEVTEAAYEILYKQRGFTPYVEPEPEKEPEKEESKPASKPKTTAKKAATKSTKKGGKDATKDK